MITCVHLVFLSWLGSRKKEENMDYEAKKNGSDNI